MFTGIVKDVGIISKINKNQNGWAIKVKLEATYNDFELGESIAVNGTCLTLTSVFDNEISFDVVKQTLDVTSLKFLEVGERVNVERSLKVGDRIGGHFVTGHVDCLGEITEIKKRDFNYWIVICAPKEMMKYITEKGSITIDGVSLTVARVKNNNFHITLVPHTLNHTIAFNYKEGDRVNLEVDILARYIINKGGV